MNVLNMYKERNNIFSSDKYKKYIEYIKLYYDEESKYKKEIDKNGFYLLKKDKNIIKIQKTNIININKYHDELLNKVNNIYGKISELITNTNEDYAKKQFDILKKEYSSIKIDITEINKLFKIQNTKLNELNIKKTNIEIELSKLYFKRKELFKKIKAINVKKKKTLISIYKKNLKMPNDISIKKLVKKLDIDYITISDWFSWINTSAKYISYQNKINALNKEIQKYIIENNKNNNNFVLSPPNIDETKVIMTGEKK